MNSTKLKRYSVRRIRAVTSKKEWNEIKSQPKEIGSDTVVLQSERKHGRKKTSENIKGWRDLL